jgi:hypothetical protein
MLHYLHARMRPNVKNATLEDMAMQLVTADKYCLQTLAQSIKRVIKERIDQLRNEAEYTEEMRRSLQGLVGSVFAEDGGKVWDDLRIPVATLVLVVMMKQKETRVEMERMMDGTPQLRKLVLDAALEAMDSSGAKEEEYTLE